VRARKSLAETPECRQSHQGISNVSADDAQDPGRRIARLLLSGNAPDSSERPPDDACRRAQPIHPAQELTPLPRRIAGTRMNPSFGDTGCLIGRPGWGSASRDGRTGELMSRPETIRMSGSPGWDEQSPASARAFVGSGSRASAWISVSRPRRRGARRPPAAPPRARPAVPGAGELYGVKPRRVKSR